MKSKSIKFYLRSKWYKKWLTKTSQRKKPTVSSPTQKPKMSYYRDIKTHDPQLQTLFLSSLYKVVSIVS